MQHSATLLPDGRVLVGGGEGSAGFLKSVEVYDPTSKTWSTTGSLNFAHDRHRATLLSDGRVLLTGGSGSITNVELYDPSSSNWLPTGSLNTARENHSSTLLPDGRVLVVGGVNDRNSIASAELYDPVINVSAKLSTLHYLWAAHIFCGNIPGQQGFKILQ